MTYRTLACLVIIFSLLAGFVQPAYAQDSAWSAVGKGIDYRYFSLPGPNRAFVARMDRNNSEAFIESSIATGEFVSGRETVSGMATRYDEAVNYWGNTWGGRNKVVIAINGDYIDRLTGQPEKGQVQSGWYARRYNDYQGQSGFAWTLDRNAFIGQCVYHKPERQYISFSNTGAILRIDGTNVPRGSDNLILYTPQYNAFTPTDSSGVEVVIELPTPLLITPQPHSLKGIVSSIHDGKGGMPIPYNAVILSATGGAREQILSNIYPGAEIGITQEITAYESDCVSPQTVDWSSTYASVGGNVTFLKDGEIQHDDERGSIIRNPRTAIAYNEQYIFFIVVDGRQPGLSVGMTIDELGAFTRDTLGAKWGISQDGGGSSTMVVNGEVVNIPSDLCHQIYIPQIGDAFLNRGTLELFKVKANLGPVKPVTVCERQVANGMLMVVQQPAEKSAFLQTDMLVNTTSPATLYLGPGTNYSELAILPSGSAGFIVEDNNGLNGILAKGSYWWKVAFGSLTGWIEEQKLSTQVQAPRALDPDCSGIPSRAYYLRGCPIQ